MMCHSSWKPREEIDTTDWLALCHQDIMNEFPQAPREIFMCKTQSGSAALLGALCHSAQQEAYGGNIRAVTDSQNRTLQVENINP